jgi:ATP-dependent DNA helicase RecG
MNLNSSLQKVKGVGEKTAEQFAAAGLHSVNDLITFLPRKYEDFSEVVEIINIRPGKMTIKARCESISTRPVRRGLRITTATLVDDSGKLQAVWFNQPYREAQLKSGEELYFSGEFEFNYNRYQLTNPSAEKIGDMPVNTDRLLPVYRAIKGLKSQLVRKILVELKSLMSMLPETLPGIVVQKYGLMSYSDAVIGVHFPETSKDVERARDRLAFEELFHLLLASQLNKLDNAKLKGYNIPFNQSTVKEFVSNLPFRLTNAQRLATWEIIQDFEKEVPMNRLLQGDVGSGKTVVAGIAALQAAKSGFQTVIMAPTDILANQHAETLSNLLDVFGVKTGLLTGKVKGKSRELLYEAIKGGEVDVVIGTHALFQDAVEFSSLGFVVIDEQHRFGVEQRQRMLAKSKAMPHLLSMTATPIPRSLALTVYGELDVSILNEMPKDRKPIKTKIWSPNSRAQLYDLVDSELTAGRQAYVVCTLIDDNPDNDIKSVEAEYKRLKGSIFKHRTIGLLHGKLKPADKAAVMDQFQRGELDILVSTTVIEVGVDVPNATVIIVENSDKFGLSQLHQLRGRVGRSVYQSYAYLVTSDSSKPSRRLREIEGSTDGFYLAEVDLQLRGAGEIYGKAQHGSLSLQIATLADTKLIYKVQESVYDFLATNPDINDYQYLLSKVAYYQKITTLN